VRGCYCGEGGDVGSPLRGARAQTEGRGSLRVFQWFDRTFGSSQNPEQWRVLTADPGIAGAAASELLRFDGPVQGTARATIEDVQIGGKTIPEGQVVTMLL
jgi:hypothetical protein